MPRISQFFGVVIYMYFNDHLPLEQIEPLD
jgi:hypothetical protein